MALWVCAKDGVRYSVGAPACPECGSGEYVEEHELEAQMGAEAAVLASEGADKQAGVKPPEPPDEKSTSSGRLATGKAQGAK